MVCSRLVRNGFMLTNRLSKTEHAGHNRVSYQGTFVTNLYRRVARKRGAWTWVRGDPDAIATKVQGCERAMDAKLYALGSEPLMFTHLRREPYASGMQAFGSSPGAGVRFNCSVSHDKDRMLKHGSG
ncbi:hypothetical protein K504DRAFT_69745 [Pleomassaria siparia CBS 279.74]|uniref:Uncharacterized protein n=1 Tax=Pleomassaria siparia CBS 279.74 TaxID=1314801 RepID=A0A6G1K3D4_9PLEO|nr:hypothetical protein K504DRAFT_69745 [Pleomassaria siparia CBS 279.74]